MNTARLVVGISLLVASALWLLEPAVLLYLGLNYFQLPSFIIAVGNMLGIAAASILLISVNKQHSVKIDWRFELVTGILLLASAVVVAIPYEIIIGGFQGGDLASIVANAFNLAGVFTFLAATAFIVIFAKTFRPICLPRTEGVSFGLLFLIGSVISLIGYVALSLDLFSLSGISSLILQISAMMVYLYPYALWKN